MSEEVYAVDVSENGFVSISRGIVSISSMVSEFFANPRTGGGSKTFKGYCSLEYSSNDDVRVTISYDTMKCVMSHGNTWFRVDPLVVSDTSHLVRSDKELEHAIRQRGEDGKNWFSFNSNHDHVTGRVDWCYLPKFVDVPVWSRHMIAPNQIETRTLKDWFLKTFKREKVQVATTISESRVKLMKIPWKITFIIDKRNLIIEDSDFVDLTGLYVFS